MWGRLDGAERIISTLLPDSPQRTELLLRAWLAILKENLDPLNLKSLRDRLGSSWEAFETAEAPSLEQMTKLQQELQTFFERHYTLDLEFSPQTTLNAMGRSINVLGSLLDGLGQKHPGVQTPAFWLTRLGKIFMDIMQVAIPGSLPGLFFRHWIKVIYVFEVFLITAGALLGFNNTVMRFGIFAFLFTLSMDLAVRLVGEYIRGESRLMRAVRAVAKLIVALALLALGALIYLGLVELGVADMPFPNLFRG
jgi:hypothetical protein